MCDWTFHEGSHVMTGVIGGQNIARATVERHFSGNGTYVVYTAASFEKAYFNTVEEAKAFAETQYLTWVLRKNGGPRGMGI